MSEYELIAFDMDGTLLDSHKQIPPETLAAIRYAVGLGKTVALATGRCPVELKAYDRQLKDVRYRITNSGALVLDTLTGETLFSRTIPPETVREILTRVRGEDLMRHMLGHGSIVQGDQIPRMAEFRMGVYQAMFEDVAQKVDSVEAFYEREPVPVCKLNLYCRDGEQRARMLARLEGLPLTITASEGTGLECTAPAISKAEGLRRLCEHLGLPMESTVAVGDGDNDREILQAAGLAVAMGNASPEVKAVADRITADNDHNGCGEIIMSLWGR